MATVALVGADYVLPLLSELTNLYAVVYAEPPYEEGPEQVVRFRDHMANDAGQPGFSMTVATHETALVGAAYGWTMSAGTWWSRADNEPTPEVRDVAKFAIMEWIVHPTRRGEGLGADLMRTLLKNRPEPLATLASDPRSAARRMYERAGWRQVGTSTLPWGPAMDLLVLDLPVRPPGRP